MTRNEFKNWMINNLYLLCAKKDGSVDYDLLLKLQKLDNFDEFILAMEIDLFPRIKSKKIELEKQ